MIDNQIVTWKAFANLALFFFYESNVSFNFRQDVQFILPICLIPYRQKNPITSCFMLRFLCSAFWSSFFYSWSTIPTDSRNLARSCFSALCLRGFVIILRIKEVLVPYLRGLSVIESQCFGCVCVWFYTRNKKYYIWWCSCACSRILKYLCVFARMCARVFVYFCLCLPHHHYHLRVISRACSTLPVSQFNYTDTGGC